MGPGRRHVRSSGRRLGVVSRGTPIAAAMGSNAAENLGPWHHGLGLGGRRQRPAPHSRMQAFALHAGAGGWGVLRQIPRAAHSRSPPCRRHVNRGAAPRSARVCGGPRGAAPRSARVCGANRGAAPRSAGRLLFWLRVSCAHQTPQRHGSRVLPRLRRVRRRRRRLAHRRSLRH